MKKLWKIIFVKSDTSLIVLVSITFGLFLLTMADVIGGKVTILLMGVNLYIFFMYLVAAPWKKKD